MKNFDIKDIKRFDWSFGIHLHLIRDYCVDLVEVIPNYSGRFNMKCKNEYGVFSEQLYGGSDLIRNSIDHKP